MASATPYVTGGTINFDGAGNITGGSVDINNGAATTATITGGTYHVFSDGRGNASVVTSSGTQNWQFALKDNTKAYIARADTNATGSGVLYRQDPTQFAVANVKGNYALELAPPASQTNGATAYAGVITADGTGNLSGGKLDASAGATVSTALTVSGSYTAPDATTGRGTMAVTTSNGTQNLAYYLVNGGRALTVELDSGKADRGELVQQSGAATSVSALAGNYSMVTSGWSTQGKVALGSVFTLDGTGNVPSATSDVNANGTFQAQAATTGSYTVTDTTTARTELTLTIAGQSRKFVLYPQASGIADALEIDGAQTTSGRAFLQASNASASSLFQGTYATSIAGQDFVNPGEIDASGVLSPNGGSAVAGALDINDAGTIARSATFQGTYLATTPATRKSGGFSTSSAALNAGQLVYYVIDANHALILELDSNRVVTGVMEKPY
jgi:hypothetical protein